jgi:hypothetical protein
VNNFLKNLFGNQIKNIAENEFGYVEGRKYQNLKKDYDTLLIEVENAEDLKLKHKQLLSSCEKLSYQSQNLTQKYEELDAAFKKLKNENVLMYAKQKADHQKVKNVFIDALSETLKFRLITPEKYEVQSPENGINAALSSDCELNEKFTKIIENYKEISSILYNKLNFQVEEKEQLERSKKELESMISARRELFSNLELHKVILEISENYWFLEKHPERFPDKYKALEKVSSKNIGNYDRQEEDTYKISVDDTVYVICISDTRKQCFGPDGSDWDDNKETYSVSIEGGNVLCSFKWSYEYDYCKTRATFSKYDVNVFKPSDWIDDLITLLKLIKTIKNYKDPLEEAEKEAKRINILKRNFDL